MVDLIFIGNLPGPTNAPSHRIRVRGGRIGEIYAQGGNTDIVFDSVVVDNDINGAASRTPTAIVLFNNGPNVVDRFAFINSMIRMRPRLVDGSGRTEGNAYLAFHSRNIFFANNNIVTAGNLNSWGFRLRGGDNFIAVDNAVRVSYHKLLRMGDGAVDYVYIKRGIWMREDTFNSVNDSFAQLGDDGTDNIYIHDPEVYLLPRKPVSFGASWGKRQKGKSWDARRIKWHAVSKNVVSDAVLSTAKSYCKPGAICDYGIGTHSYRYDPNLKFPENPWRILDNLPEDNPDKLPSPP